jgi:hypothetical protein
VNRQNEQYRGATGTALLPLDQQRRALEHRLELAKERLVADLDRVSSMLQLSAGSVRQNVRSVVRVVARGAIVLGGLLLLGIVRAVVRRRRRLAWRFL